MSFLYQKSKEITPYWLYVKDVQSYFHLTVYEADAICSELWPDSQQRETYKSEARRRKQYLKSNGPFPKTPAHLLSTATIRRMGKLSKLTKNAVFYWLRQRKRC